ncbi:MAG: hypothetical protein CMJ18_00190 [Phycisphaeraceae bacterium]|nr:hypothetical protein [Phycisphaeraceae bacterium]
MPSIEVTDRHVVYENPHPQNRARHAYFPGLVNLPSGDLLALFILGEALEATNVTTVVSRSADQGRTWQFEGPLHERDAEHRFDSDYMKPLVLSDGSLLATGYRFNRSDPDELATNADGGVRPGDNLVSFSRDEGRSWTPHQVVSRSTPEVIEQSGPAIQLRSGTILASGSLYPMWDGSHPSGCIGVLSRSDDGGATWDDRTRFFKDPRGRFHPAEPRLCEMQDDRVVALVWMMDDARHEHDTNHVTVSHDGGASWSDPIDTGLGGQASNLAYLGEERLLSIHSHREGSDIGVYVRIVDFSNDTWRTVEQEKVWGNAPSKRTANYATIGQNLKFGQPSVLRLADGDILATHWAFEDGQGSILSHRLRIG